ncbi:MAG: AI-2E family transporter [archaeon]
MSLEKVLFAVTLILGAIMLKPFIMPLLLAIITAYVMFPMVNGLRKFFKSYHFALILSVVIIITPLILIIMYSINDISPLIWEVTGLSKDISKSLVTVEEVLSDYGVEGLASNIQITVTDLTEYLKAEMTRFVFTIPMLMLNIAIYLISTYYFLMDGAKVIRFVNDYVNTFEYREKRMIQSIILGLKNSFDVLFLSYITISVIVTIFAWIGFYLLGVPYAAALALLAGIFGFLPLLGIWVIYTAVGMYKLINGDVTGALLVISYGVIFLNIIPDLFIRPSIGAKTGNVHPMTIILGFIGGPLIFGTSGFLIGPILLVIVETVIVSYMKFNINLEKKEQKEK